MILILKGFLIGIAKVVPGVSGAIIAISLGVYEESLKAIGNFFDNPIKNFKYLVLLFIGIFLSIISTSKLIIYLFNNFYLPTIVLFIGLMFGGFPNLFKKIEKAKFKHYVVMILSFAFVLFISLFDGVIPIFKSGVTYFIIGIIDAITMIIPGISGTAIMIILDVYNLLLELVSSLTSINNIISNLKYIIPYVLGIGITIILLSKLMQYLFSKHNILTYCFIIGFTFSSILLLVKDLFNNKYSILEIIISLILLIIGYVIGNKLDN